MSVGNGTGTAKKGVGESIVITSGKGGVGKTTVTATLGSALALRGKRTLVVDADIGLRNLDVILGLENRIVFNLVDVAKNVCKPSQALIKSKKTPNLFLLPASQTDDKDVVSEDDIKAVLENYRKEFNYILIDSPAGIEQGFRNACAAADQAYIVTTPEISAIRDADRVIGLLNARGIEPRLIINRLDRDLVRRGDMLSVKDVEEILGIDLLGVVERDDSVIVAANNGEPVVFNQRSRAGRSFNTIAARITGEQVAVNAGDGFGFWERVSRRLGMGA